MVVLNIRMSIYTCGGIYNPTLRDKKSNDKY